MPKLVIRMLIIGDCMGIRSGRRMCAEVHLNRAYYWLWRLGLRGDKRVHSTVWTSRNGRFRDGDRLRGCSSGG